jgi:hypothetical protein
MEPWFMAQDLKPAKTLRPIRTISDGVKATDLCGFSLPAYVGCAAFAGP